jgi:hypothetical protein
MMVWGKSEGASAWILLGRPNEECVLLALFAPNKVSLQMFPGTLMFPGSAGGAGGGGGGYGNRGAADGSVEKTLSAATTPSAIKIRDMIAPFMLLLRICSYFL